MADLNTAHNRAVWFDIPVEDLERANSFYRAVLGCDVTTESYEGLAFSVIALIVCALVVLPAMIHVRARLGRAAPPTA